MEEIVIPKLALEQVEELCEMAEANAREYVLSKVPSHKASTLNVAVDGDCMKPLTLNIVVEVVLSPLTKNLDAPKMVENAAEGAFVSVEAYLRDF